MKEHTYEITLKHTEDAEGNKISDQQITFTVSNHDDIFKIIEIAKSSGNIGENTEELVLGLKLFTNVCMKRRKEEPYASVQSILKTLIPIFKKEIKGAKD